MTAPRRPRVSSRRESHPPALVVPCVNLSTHTAPSEEVDEVGVQAAALEAAGGVGGEQAGDALLADLRLAAEAELAVDDCAAQAAGE